MNKQSDVYVDEALTNLSVAYQNPMFISDLVAPNINLRKQSDRYYIYDAGKEAFRPSTDTRDPGTATKEIEFTLSNDTYFCNDHALMAVVPDEERENADPPLQPSIDRTEFLRSKIDLNKEIELADKLTSTTVITQNTTLSGTAMWSDQTSDPVSAVEDKKGVIMSAVQAMPNTLILGYEVYSKLRNHSKIISRISYIGKPSAVTAEALAQIFDVERVLVARAFKNTAASGQTASMSYVWGKNAILCFTPKRSAIKQIGLASTFSWAGAPGSLSGHRVDMWRDEKRKADVIRVQRYYDQKIIAPQAAFLWKNAIA